MRLHQAVFTSIKGPRLDGYQLAGLTSGIAGDLAKELTLWGPAHDSLWDTRQDARSVNFHPLATGDYCLSCTTLAGEEYSGRGGGRVYTQMFVLPQVLLARFANDPFLVLRALAAAGRLVVHEKVPETLPSVPLLGSARPPDESQLAQPQEELGPAVFQEVLSALPSSPRVAVMTSGHVERLFQALLHALPAEDRLSISFTTNLKDSPRRPFKLFVLPNDPSLMRQSQRLSAVRIIDLAGEPALS
jgi:hypothetical protein